MITIEELSTKVKEEFTDKYTLAEWEKKKNNLGPMYCPEYMDANRIEWVESNGYLITYDEDLAYFCWRCGCSLSVSQDWDDGSPTCTLWLPATEEEYQENLREADKWWKEVMEN